MARTVHPTPGTTIESDELMRQCGRCKQDKPISDFPFYTTKGKTRRRSYCPPCAKQYGQQYRKRRCEELLEYSKRKYQQNKERNHRAATARRLANPDLHHQYQKRWRDSPRGRALRRRNDAMRNAIKRGSNLIVPVTIEYLLDRDGSDCWICGIQTVKSDRPLMPTIDHVIPISRGGQHIPSNCKVAHLRCNQIKNDRMPYEVIA